MKDLGSLHDRLETLGDRLKGTVKAFNEMIPAAESTVVRSANRLKELDVQGRELPNLEHVTDVRELKSKLELPE
jgi:DNA anti-recombination protein RmuC